MKRLLVAIAGAALAAGSSTAQSPVVVQALASGQAGERYDGYMGLTGAASPELERQVRAVNLQRRNLYIQLSAKRNVSPELVGMATGCQLLRGVLPGQAFMLADRLWRRRAAGQAVPLPPYCE